MRSGLVSCLDFELHVAVGSEPERLEAATLPAIEAELVTDTGDRLAIDLVAIALVSLCILECFGVDEPDGAARTATRLEDGECIGEVSLIEQNNRPGLCGHDEVARSPQEAGIGRDPLTAPNGREPYRRLLHRRDRTRHELPAARFAEGIARAELRAVGAGAPASRRRDPAILREVGLRPAPWITARVDRLARRRRVVPADDIPEDRNGRVAVIAQHLPLRTRVHDRLARAVSLQQERRLTAELRDGLVRPPVPHERRDDVAACSKLGGHIDRLVAPVHQVGTLRPGGHLLAIDEQPVAVVGGHVDDETRRLGVQLEHTTEMEDAEVVAARARGKDPRRRRCSAEDPGRRRLAPRLVRLRTRSSRG